MGPITHNGMVWTSWGELLVDDGGGNAISRFSLDAQGSVTPNGTITGNGLNFPIGLAFAPWDELFVVNQGTGVLSRFTFDSSHAPVANGTYQVQGPTTGGQGGFGWILIVPGGSTTVNPDAGVADASSGD